MHVTHAGLRYPWHLLPVLPVLVEAGVPLHQSGLVAGFVLNPEVISAPVDCFVCFSYCVFFLSGLRGF